MADAPSRLCRIALPQRSDALRFCGLQAVRGAQTEAIEKLLDRALVDPDLAAQLLKEGNPANRAALARKAKAFLGNEAAHLAVFFDGDQQEDSVKAAIMR
jgi:hypothetical protein